MTQLFLINEKGQNWAPARLANQTGYYQVSEGQESPLTAFEFEQALTSLKGKRVLVLLHGLNNPKKTVLENWTKAQEYLLKLNSTKDDSYWKKFRRLFSHYTGLWKPENEKVYDAIIGISWPSYDHEFYYYQAKRNAHLLAPKIACHLDRLAFHPHKLDIVAHSLGNYLLFTALAKHSSSVQKFHTIFSIGAAVPNHTLNHGNAYHKVAQTCRHLFVLHSHHDEALYWPFYLAEGGQNALGLTGPNQKHPLPHNIRSINCSDVIKDHSAYLSNTSFYQFLERHHNEKYNAQLQKANSFKLTANADLIS